MRPFSCKFKEYEFYGSRTPGETASNYATLDLVQLDRFK
jgi:hypothetical protein